MEIVLDIETIPSTRPDLGERLAAKIAPPAITRTGKYKTEDDVERWRAEELPALVDEKMHAAGLSGATGEIVCIGVAFDNDPPQVFSSARGGEDELRMLTRFDFTLRERLDTPRQKSRQPTWIGHNLLAFDLRFLRQRAIARRQHGLLALLPDNPKPWESSVYDTMAQWAGVGNRISLDDLAWALGLDGKTGMTGADVWPAWQAGEIDKIADYCAADVELTRAVYRAMRGAYA